MELPLLLPQGRGVSLPLNAQRTVNLYPVMDPGDPSQPSLVGTPGCVAWVTVHADAPARGALQFDGIGYVVFAGKFYTVTTAGVVTERGTLNTLEGAVTLDTNGLQVIVADGACSVTCIDNYGIVRPSADGNFYVYDIESHDFAEMTPPDVPSGQSFYVTALADFTTVDALAFASAESSPDDLVRVFGDGELFLFGTDSSEAWRDDAGDFPFVRLEPIRQGLGAQNAVTKFDNSIAFIGADRKIYKLNGYTAVRLSDAAVEISLAGMADISDCIAFSYDQDAAKFAVFVFPSAGVTWAFDAACGLWHERSSNGGAWRARAYLKLGNRHLIGDESGKLLEFRTDLYDEDGDDLIAQHVLPAIRDDRAPISHDRLELVVEAGVGLVDGVMPSLLLDWSDDGGRSFSSRLSAPMGKIGEYLTRVVFTRLGRAISRNYRITISAPVKRVIIGASGEGMAGRK